MSPSRPSVFPRLAVAALLAGSLALATAAPASAAEPEASLVSGAPEGVDSLVQYDGALYLAGHDGGESGVFRFDGTDFTLLPGSPMSTTGYSELDGDLYMIGYDGADYLLYRFDGATFTPIAPAYGGTATVVVDDVLYFIDVSVGFSSWDGTTVTPLAGSPSNVYQPIGWPAEGAVLFSAGTTNTFWAYAGGFFYDYNTDLSLAYPVSVSDIAVYGGLVYFSGFDGSEYGLWRYTGAGIERVDTLTDVFDVFAFAGLLYFTAYDDGESLLHSFDGTTIAAVPGSPPSPFGSQVGPDGVAYFIATVDGSGYPTLHAFDGVTFTNYPGTTLAGQANGGTAYGFAVLGGQLYFVATTLDAIESLQLWTLAPPGTTPAATLPPTGADAVPLAAAGVALTLAGLAALALRRRAFRSRA